MISRILFLLSKPRPGGRVLAILAALTVHAAMPAQAAVDAFLTMKSAQGEVVDTDATHSWVELVGFSQGTDRPGSIVDQGSPGTTAKTAGQSMLMLRLDRSLADLMNANISGTRMRLTLHLVGPSSTPQGRSVMTELNFENTYITFVQGNVSGGEEAPVFSVGLKYAQMTWAYTWLDNSGRVQGGSGAGFDFTTQRVYGISNTIPSLGDYVAGQGTGNPDSDNDGMPDAWETANGLNPSNPADANEDRDKDGRSNRDEYVAGTNPNSGASFFRATVQGPGTANPGQIKLSWNSVAGKSYKILAADTPAGPFVQVASVTGLATETSHTIPVSQAKRFFKITVE